MAGLTKALAMTVAGVAVFATTSSTVQAQAMACGERATILAALERDYREQPVAIGLDAQGRMLEVLAAPDGKTWTILVTQPSGLTCLVASGIAWEVLPAGFGPLA